jgi:hypothetical protein
MGDETKQQEQQQSRSFFGELHDHLKDGIARLEQLYEQRHAIARGFRMEGRSKVEVSATPEDLELVEVMRMLFPHSAQLSRYCTGIADAQLRQDQARAEGKV